MFIDFPEGRKEGKYLPVEHFCYSWAVGMLGPLPKASCSLLCSTNECKWVKAGLWAMLSEEKAPNKCKAQQESPGNQVTSSSVCCIHWACNIFISGDLLPTPKQVSAAPWRFTLQWFGCSTYPWAGILQWLPITWRSSSAQGSARSVWNEELRHSIRIWTVQMFMVDRSETSLSAELLRSNGFIHCWITLI